MLAASRRGGVGHKHGVWRRRWRLVATMISRVSLRPSWVASGTMDSRVATNARGEERRGIGQSMGEGIQ